MKYSQYKKMRQRLEADFHRDLSALDLMWKKFGDKSTIEKNSGLPKGAYGNLISTVLQTAESIDGTFSIRQIFESVKPFIPDVRLTSISVALKRLVKKGAIVEIEKGSGRRPSTYTVSKGVGKMLKTKSQESMELKPNEEVPF